MRGKERSTPHGSAMEPYTLSLKKFSIKIHPAPQTQELQGISGNKQPSGAVGKAKRKKSVDFTTREFT